MNQRSRATCGLVGACLFWGLSFPCMKALSLRAAESAPGVSTWCVAALSLCVRFALSAVVLLGLRHAKPTRAEFAQGAALAVFTTVGMLLQMDGLNFTAASTSAFFTQGYVFMIPIIIAVERRHVPSLAILLCVVMDLIGLGILADFDFAEFRVGRGELETLGAAFCFAWQILWLDKKKYAHNRTGPVSFVMFSSMVVLLLPLALASARSSADMAAVLGSAPTWGLLLTLTLFCTLGSFLLMNRFQRFLNASEAGIIYGAEPLFTSIFALFLPGLISHWCNLDYPNESLHWRWLMGGGLVLLANLLIHIPPFADKKLQAAPQSPSL